VVLAGRSWPVRDGDGDRRAVIARRSMNAQYRPEADIRERERSYCLGDNIAGVNYPLMRIRDVRRSLIYVCPDCRESLCE
jgi:hypothetical protein